VSRVDVHYDTHTPIYTVEVRCECGEFDAAFYGNAATEIAQHYYAVHVFEYRELQREIAMLVDTFWRWAITKIREDQAQFMSESDGSQQSEKGNQSAT
jgi:hypothetical protein